MISPAFIRQSHRWLGIALTLTVLANVLAMPFGPPPPALTYAPLLPLFLLMGSGLYLFFQPHREAMRGRSQCQISDR